eukprot:TRINITY_DN41752_c0_g1_i1.p1 TRINITY_DN41752_c0_g1~~TRINITY_DN41752_c0_g1_i1.p1  ORF type:complete len:493 (-),score=95.14 TRINITY_DN41752_c0_g1_i1:97-1575(-)
MFLIGYDVLMIPFSSAFQPEQNTVLFTADMILLLFWTADMFQALNLGFYTKGRYVNSHRQIWLNYLKTWFVVDLIVVGPEWMSIIAGSGDIFGGASRMLKTVRAVRVLRLLRLLKLQRIINMLYDMLESEYTFIVVNLAKLLLSVSVMNHLIACAWFLLGRFCMENDIRNWIEVGGVEKETLGYKYTTSLHWSLTQFTPASMDISARNVYERIFSIVVLFFAMVAFSSIVASITGAMTSLRNLSAEQNKQFWLLRRYLRQRNIKNELSSRIIKFLEYTLEQQRATVQLGSISLFSGLSEELRQELAHQLNHPFLTSNHVFFNYMERNMLVVMQRLCHKGLSTKGYAEKEVVFSAGEAASNMFVVKQGSCVYSYTDKFAHHQLEPPLQKMDQLCEPILWTSWRHRGELMADTPLDLVLLSPDIFLEILSQHPHPHSLAKRYGCRFLHFINSVDRSRLLDVLRPEVIGQDLNDACRDFDDDSDEMVKTQTVVVP